MSDVATRNHSRELIAVLREDERFKGELKVALPDGVTPDRFIRLAITALQASPDIAEHCDQPSILRSLLAAAQMGLVPDGKEAALVAFGGKATLIPMIGGFRKIAADHGWTIRTGTIREHDDFDFELGDAPRLTHRPPRPGVERGELIGAYAVGKHIDGRVEIEVMSAADVAKVRAVSKSANRGPWKEWEDRMWEKTPGRRLFAKLPLGDGDERIARIIALSRVEPDEARATLYGPARSQAQLPPAAEDVGGQQAEALMGNASAPGPTDDDAGDGEPDLEPQAEASPFTPPVDPAEDPAVAAAMQAAMFEIPNGKHKGVSLGEVLGKPGGETWLGWALTHIENPPPYRQAIHDFARVYSPEQYQQALGQAELAS